MAFLVDKFNSASLVSLGGRSADTTGSTWSAGSGALALQVGAGTGTLICPAGSEGTQSQYKNAAFPPSADYSVRARIKINSSSSLGAGVLARYDDTSSYTWYDLQLQYNGTLTLYVYSGSRTWLGQVTVPAAANGAWTVIELVVSGTSISAKANGATVIGPITNSAASAVGKAGVYNDRATIDWVQGGTTAEADPEVVSSGSVSAALVLDGQTVAGEMLVSTSILSGDLGLDGATVGGVVAPQPGVLVSPPLKNNAGTLLAGVSNVVVNLYNPTTGVLIVRKTGLSSDTAGVVTVSDPLIVPGVSYSYEVDLSAASLGRRLPVGVAS